MTWHPWSVSPGECWGQWSQSEAGGGRAIAGARTRLEPGLSSVSRLEPRPGAGDRTGITWAKQIKVIISDVVSEKGGRVKVYAFVVYGSNVTWMEINLVRVNPIKVLWLNIAPPSEINRNFWIQITPAFKVSELNVEMIGAIFTCNIFIWGPEIFSLCNQSWCLFVQRRPGGERWLLKQTKTIAICR